MLPWSLKKTKQNNNKITIDERVKQKGHSKGLHKDIQRIVHKKQQVKKTRNWMTFCYTSRKNYRKIAKRQEVIRCLFLIE